MSRKEMYYNAETDMWMTKSEVIDSIQTITGCTEAEVVAHLDDSIENGIIYDYNGYMEHFTPYENN